MSETVFQNAAPTKIVSARLPIPEYIKFLQAATDAKMSVSEFFYYKIYQDDKISELAIALSDKESRIKDLEEMVSENRGYAEQWKGATETSRLNEKKLQAELSTLKTQINALNEAEKRYKGEINADSKTVAELKAQIAKLQGEKTTLQAEKQKLSEIITKWAQNYDALKALASSVRNEVISHMQKQFVFYDLPLEKIVNKLK